MSRRAPAVRDLLRRRDAVLLTGLARRLLPGPIRPTALVHAFDDHDGYLAFVRFVTLVFPEDERQIMEPPDSDLQDGLAAARMAALLRCVERDYFPCDELWDPDISYGSFMAAVPFAYHAWGDDDLHFLDAATDADDLLLIAALAPFVRDEVGDAVFDLAAEHVGREPLALLTRVAVAGDEEWQRRWRDHPRYGPLVDMLRWLRGDTGIAQLDFSPERYENDLEWSLENLCWLRDEHARARALLDRLGALAAWLREAPQHHFAQLIQDVYREEIATLEHEHTTNEAPAGDEGSVPGLGPDQFALSLGAAPG